MKLSDKTERKFIEVIDISNDGWAVESIEGFVPVTHLNKTIPYDVFEISIGDKTLKCADTHILIDENYNEMYAIDSDGRTVITKDGNQKVMNVLDLGYKENMYDLSVKSENHVYYTNDILSHNTVTVATYILWKALFYLGDEMTIGIAANKQGMAIEVLDKIKNIFVNLPFWLMTGVNSWNKKTVEFENKVRILTSATNGDSFRGFTLELLYIDECVEYNETITVRDKETGVVETLKIGKLYDRE